MPQNLDLITKRGGVTALLVCTLAISSPASALNTTIGSTSSTIGPFGFGEANVGQSFINDPVLPAGRGIGATINLNTWTFRFVNETSQTTATGTTLTIYNGIGNGGTIVGTSANASTARREGSTFPVTWTFAGGLQIIDTSTYTAVLTPTLFYGIGSYPNGSLTIGTTGAPSTGDDTLFRATFSAATPVPFEFSPALGLIGLGALWLAKKKYAKKTK